MLKVRAIDRWEDLEPLGEVWNPILADSAANTIFLTWEWVRSWWRAYGIDRELFVLAFERDGRLVGLAPFCRRRILRYGLVRYASLSFLGDGTADSDYLDLIVRPGEEVEVAAVLVDYLEGCGAEWDVLFLNEVPATSPLLPALEGALRDAGYRWSQRSVTCAEVCFRTSWEEYLRSLQSRMRTKIRSLVRRLEESHQFRFEYCAAPEALASNLDSLFRLHQQRWRRDGGKGVFDSKRKRRFYEEISRSFLQRGWLRLANLEVDGCYRAHQFCFEYGNVMYLLQEGYDPDWRERGIGNVLRAYVFRDCIERGVAGYDFLGGMTAHKRSWGAVEKTSFRITIVRPRAPGWLYITLPSVLDRGLGWARTRIARARSQLPVVGRSAARRPTEGVATPEEGEA